MLPFFEWSGTYTFEPSFLSYLYVILLGGIDAFTSIVPGISGTALFMMLGSYEFVLSILGNPFTFLFVLYGIGLIIGILFTCYLMYYLLKHKRDEINVVILAFALSSILFLFLNVKDCFSLFLFLFFILGVILGYVFDE